MWHLEMWFRGDYDGAGVDLVVLKVFSNLDDSGIDKEIPCTVTPLFKGLEGRIQVPYTLKIPSVRPLVLFPLFRVAHLSPGKGFAPLFPLGCGLGEHNRCQTHSALPIPFPKDSKSAPNRPLESPAAQQGKSLDCSVTEATVCVLSLPLARASVEIQRKAGSINIAV